MLFGYHVVDRTLEEHLREIAALANDPQTLIFLDTNILTYLYKLHEAARLEFFQWSDALARANRLVIPAWAASEYLARVTSKTLDSYTPKSKEANQAAKLLNGLLETASLFVDDTSLRRIEFPRDRAAFIAEFRGAIDALAPFTRVFSQNFDFGVIHQQIETHLSSVILDSDLAALCSQANREGPGRFEHRIPPGFRDEDKSENRFGDLIIWLEILEESARRKDDFPKVLFITRDEKSDWVYAPKLRKELVRGDRKAVGNTQPELKLADPRLVAEFRRKAGHTNLTIAGIGHLVEGLSKTDPALFTHLAAAIQINTEQSEPTGSATPAPPEPGLELQVAPAPEIPAEVALEPAQQIVAVTDAILEGRDIGIPAVRQEPKLKYDREALQDQSYPADAPGMINEIIRDLKSHNWYTQNPAISKIRSLREQDGIEGSSWFVLGRNIYQAACGNSQKAMEFVAALSTQLPRLPDAAGQHLLAGMLFEVYFDSHGAFRDEPKFTYADKLLSVITQPNFADALAFITHHLHPHRTRLKFFPGDTDRKIICITSRPIALVAVDAKQGTTEFAPPLASEVRSILFEGVELLRDIVADDQNKWQDYPRRKISPERIKERISDDLAIPEWALKLDMQPQVEEDVQLALPNSKVFDPKLMLP